ncbi:hypothetical protein CERZMDRAFT_97935 [Cercospora zeae-maydis SCOH1-5]|uniref:Uncharacterized protein n=1 Tax=Cercospora zeae-maydis SCOH1-5 TaxID=717836 RepID=A0A6A6FFK5_9PEZI|nr:hypothetical protein CERZMDRAFT_97935 [Cercospora zeae-maydis SCOH1-5]
MQCTQDQHDEQFAKNQRFTNHTNHKSSAYLDANQVAWSLIDVGLVKTHAKCLPGDIVFVPYQVDNVIYHFPLPPGSQTPQPSPPDTSIQGPKLSDEHMTSSMAGDGMLAAPRQEKVGTNERQMRRKTRVRSTSKNFLIGVDSLQRKKTSPPSYEEAMAQQERQQGIDETEVERQNTLKMLENHNSADSDCRQYSTPSTKCLTTGIPPAEQTARDRHSPTRPLTSHQLSQDDGIASHRPRPGRIHSRSASIPIRQTETCSRSPSSAKAQLVLGISEPRKSSIEQLFDQAVLEFQQQTAETAERMSYRNDIGMNRWASNSARRSAKSSRNGKAAAADAPIYVPGKSWRPTAKIHRHVAIANSQGITISTPALAKRLGVPVGTHTALRM